MKRTFLSILFLSGCMANAQVPANYYNSASGLTGYSLKAELHDIISTGHNSQTYSALWAAFQTSDDDQYYEDDGRVLDIYSENPNGNDSYDFMFMTKQCGNYSGEGDCYNREHLMPQSWFNENPPMKTDIHHIFPTDGYVNGIRGHLPFGEVGTANYTSDNGSKRGNNIVAGYNGTVFEPIDEFKGDVARAYFYMATRYEEVIASWENENDGSIPTFDGSSDQVFEDWVVSLLLDWHTNDPVSPREIDRNDDAYNFQGNANPYIDHPEYVGMIWGSNMAVSTGKNAFDFELYPNPVSGNSLELRFSSPGETKVCIYNILGELLLDKTVQKQEVQLTISNLKSGVYLIKVVRNGNVMVRKLVRNL